MQIAVSRLVWSGAAPGLVHLYPLHVSLPSPWVPVAYGPLEGRIMSDRWPLHSENLRKFAESMTLTVTNLSVHCENTTFSVLPAPLSTLTRSRDLPGWPRGVRGTLCWGWMAMAASGGAYRARYTNIYHHCDPQKAQWECNSETWWRTQGQLQILTIGNFNTLEHADISLSVHMYIEECKNSWRASRCIVWQSLRRR